MQHTKTLYTVVCFQLYGNRLGKMYIWVWWCELSTIFELYSVCFNKSDENSSMMYITIDFFSHFQNSDSMVPPPAPPLKAQTSPLANMFSQEIPRSPISPEPYSGKTEPPLFQSIKTVGEHFLEWASFTSLPYHHCCYVNYVICIWMRLNWCRWIFCDLKLTDQDSLDGSGMSRSTSVSSGMNLIKKPRVQTIFPHTGVNDESVLCFDDGEIITLLIQDEKDGWLYGELEKNGQ